MQPKGHHGEVGWTNSDVDHYEITSSVAHVIGVAVGHCVTSGSAKVQTPSRGGHGFVNFDWEQVPTLFRIPTGDQQHKKTKSSDKKQSSNPASSRQQPQPLPPRGPSPAHSHVSVSSQGSDLPDWGEPDIGVL